MMDDRDRLLDSYHSTCSGEHGWDYKSKIYADVNGCVWVDESIQHFDKEYPQDESQQFTTFEEAWRYFYQRAAYSEYHGMFFENAKRKAAALRLYGGKQLVDDLENLSPDEIICGADTAPGEEESEPAPEHVAEPAPVEAECKLHAEIRRHLEALRATAAEAQVDIYAEIEEYEDKLKTLRAALDDKLALIGQIDSLLHPEPVRILNAPEEFSLSPCTETMTATELAQQLGIKPKKIYDALDKGELHCLPRVPRGKVRFDKAQVQCVLSYFGGIA